MDGRTAKYLPHMTRAGCLIPVRPHAGQYFAGAMTALRYYERRILTAEAPDHPIAIEAYRKMVEWESKAIAWASLKR